MRNSRPFVIALALIVLAWAAPAEAALPTSPPSETLACANGKTAKAWMNYGAEYGLLSMLAVDNPCKGQWVELAWPGWSVSDPYGQWIYVAPGKRFNWDGPRLREWRATGEAGEFTGARLVAPGAACVRNYEAANGWSSFNGKLVYSYDDVRAAPECGEPKPKYTAVRYKTIRCPSDQHTAELAWKVEGKKLVKLAADNSCSGRWAVAWWRLENGRTVGIWIEPGVPTDLWKAELDGLPTKTKDGNVSFALAQDLGADPGYAGVKDAKKRPFYYNGFASGDVVSCTAGQAKCK